MDEYIYNLPPPPPPPSSIPNKPSSSNKCNVRAAQNNNRPHPYKRDQDTAFDEESTLISAIKVDIKDIEQWIADRKKNWPSNKRMAEKEKEKLEQDTRKNQGLRDGLLAEKATNTSSNEKQNITEGNNNNNYSYYNYNSNNNVHAGKRICNYFSKAGKCRNGDNCRFVHERNSNNNKRQARKYERFEKPERMSLFKRLVQNDYDQENANVLDFIVHLHENGIIHPRQ